MSTACSGFAAELTRLNASEARGTKMLKKSAIGPVCLTKVGDHTEIEHTTGLLNSGSR